MGVEKRKRKKTREVRRESNRGAAELRALLAGLSIAEGKADQLSSGAHYWLSQMDTSDDRKITFDEFYNNVAQ